MAWLNVRGMKGRIGSGVNHKETYLLSSSLDNQIPGLFHNYYNKPVFIIHLLLAYKLFFKKIVEEAMSLFSEYPIPGIRFCLLPSPKEMMRMDSICFNSPWNEQDYREMQEQSSFNNWLLEIPDVGQVGMLVFQSVPPELEIHKLRVSLLDGEKMGW